MKELKEPEITLFGRKIVLPENEEVVTAGEESSEEINNGSGGGGDGVSCLEVSDGGEGEGEKDDGDDDDDDDDAIEEQVAESCETKPQEKDQNPDESKHLNSSSELDKNPKTPPIDEDGTSTKSESEPMNGPQKTILKKPDKILPCPRCNSMDTKFCYYNNYNINQPRHFCKSCQRYWTAGGTMRNVPVGAGRRKNKNSGPNCRHITISEALQSKSPSFKPNGTVLSFGPDSPLCESVASALSLTDKRTQNGVRNGYHKNGENIDDGSMTSAVMTQNAEPGGEIGPNQPVIHNINGFPFPVPCIPGIAPWNFPVAVPAILPFYPGPYWNYSLPNTWNFPWPTAQSSPTNQISTTGSDPTSPLGKHSRNGELLKTKCFENKETLELKNSVKSSVVVPKTLRIDDPEEAAKSSIWETLGIKYDSVSREGLFKALQPKDSEGKLKISASPVLQANPAALSRSISFQEGA